MNLKFKRKLLSIFMLSFIISCIINVQVFKVEAEEQRTPIMGTTQVTKAQMIKYFQQNNTIKDYNYINNFVSIVLNEAEIEGVRADVAFAQMMKETNFLKFTGEVKEEQNNFAGMKKPSGQGEGYHTFPDIQTGIRGVIQHLKCYASTEPIKQAIVDPRYANWLRGKAQYVEWLGINENPEKVGWAEDPGYGYDIVNRVNQMIAIKTAEEYAKLTNFSIPNNFQIGQSNLIGASATSANGAMYQFWVGDRTTETWTMIQNYNSNSSVQWTPTKPGLYTIVVNVKDKYSTRSEDDYSKKDVVIGTGTAKLTSFDIGSAIEINRPSIINASATSTNGALYQFWVGDRATEKWTMIQDYNANSTVQWTPTKPGLYTIVANVKDKYSTRSEDDYSKKDIVIGATAKLNSFNLGTNIEINKQNTISADAVSANGALYQFWVGDRTTETWTMIQNYNSNSSVQWTPTKPGLYTIVVNVKDKYSTSSEDDYSKKDVVIGSETAKLTNFDLGSAIEINKPSVINASATSANGALYQFWVGDRSTEKWTMIQNYNSNSSVQWTPTKPGLYTIVVNIKDKYSTRSEDDYAKKELVVGAVAKLNSFNLGTNIEINKQNAISADAVSANGALYQFWVGDRSTEKWTMIQDYNSNSSVQWTPTKPGLYTIVVNVKDKYSPKSEDINFGKNVEIKSGIFAKTIVLDAGHGGTESGAVGSGYVEKILNNEIVKKLGVILEKLGAKVLYTRSPNTDATASLQERVDYANGNAADLFLSVHHNSSEDNSAHGTEVHYSSYRPGIETEDAYVYYQGKYYKFIREGSGGYYIDYNGSEKFVSNKDSQVYDRTPSVPASESASFAKSLVDAVASLTLDDSGTKLTNRGIQETNKYVTRWTNMPSVLLEVGFMSNPIEIAKVANSTFQDAIAQKIGEVLSIFFDR